MVTAAAPAVPSATRRKVFAVTAAVAWLGLALTLLFSALGWYRAAPVEVGMYGDHPDGIAGAVSRVSDTLSYFTIWSNAAVALAATALARESTRRSRALEVLRLDSMLMITVTAIVYAVVLAPTAVIEGWSKLTDPLLHQVTPAIALLGWIAVGPRGWITWRTVLASLAVPMAWLVWMLARGAVIDAYPYPFVNVVELGYPIVARNLGAILLFGIIVASLYWALDALLTRTVRRRPSSADSS